MSYVHVLKLPNTCGRGCTSTTANKVEFLDVGNPPSTVDVANNSNIDKWTVVHEFGHVIDGKNGWRLSQRLMEITEGRYGQRPQNCDPDQRKPGCNARGYFYGGVPPKGSDAGFNHIEDFAESVAATVYPWYARSQVERFRGTIYHNYLYYDNFSTSTNKRYQYIISLRSNR